MEFNKGTWQDFVDVRDFIVRGLRELGPMSAEELRNQRYARFRKF